MQITLTPYELKFDFANHCILCGKRHNIIPHWEAKKYDFWIDYFEFNKIKNIKYAYCSNNNCYKLKYGANKVWAKQVAKITGLRLR